MSPVLPAAQIDAKRRRPEVTARDRLADLRKQQEGRSRQQGSRHTAQRIASRPARMQVASPRMAPDVIAPVDDRKLADVEAGALQGFDAGARTGKGVAGGDDGLGFDEGVEMGRELISWCVGGSTPRRSMASLA